MGRDVEVVVDAVSGCGTNPYHHEGGGRNCEIVEVEVKPENRSRSENTIYESMSAYEPLQAPSAISEAPLKQSLWTNN